MSILTQCNYCRLRSIRHEAEEIGKVVTVNSNNVFVHPADRLPDTTVDEDGNCGPDWVAWLAEIPQGCVC